MKNLLIGFLIIISQLVFSYDKKPIQMIGKVHIDTVDTYYLITDSLKLKFIQESGSLDKIVVWDASDSTLKYYDYGVYNLDITYYVDSTDGSDLNDGSISSPFKTLDFALSSLPENWFNSTITINLDTGTYYINNLHIYATYNSTLTIQSTMKVIFSGFTSVQQADVQEYKTDTNFNYGRVVGNFITKGSTYLPIWKNIDSSLFSKFNATAPTAIYKSIATIIIDDATLGLNINFQNITPLALKKVNIEFLNRFQFWDGQNYSLELFEVFVNTANISGAFSIQKPNLDFNSVVFHQRYSVPYHVNVSGISTVIDWGNIVLYADKGLSTTTALNIYNTGDFYIKNTWINGYGSAIRFADQGGNVRIETWNHRFTVYNCNNAFIINPNSSIKRGALDFATHPGNYLILDSVNYIFNWATIAMPEAAYNIYLCWPDEYVIGEPLIGVTDFTAHKYFIVPDRGMTISLPFLYEEIQTNTERTFLNNTIDSFQIGDSTQNRIIKVDMLVTRNDSTINQELIIIYNSGNVFLNIGSTLPYSGNPTLGINWEAVLIDSRIYLKYTISNTGYDGNMRFNVSRIMKT